MFLWSQSCCAGWCQTDDASRLHLSVLTGDTNLMNQNLCLCAFSFFSFASSSATYFGWHNIIISDYLNSWRLFDRSCLLFNSLFHIWWFFEYKSYLFTSNLNLPVLIMLSSSKHSLLMSRSYFTYFFESVSAFPSLELWKLQSYLAYFSIENCICSISLAFSTFQCFVVICALTTAGVVFSRFIGGTRGLFFILSRVLDEYYESYFVILTVS